MEETVLIYIEQNDKYLMMLRNKKSQDLNKGKYIGIGGHIEHNETRDEAIVREVEEETSLKLKSHIYRAKLLFINDDYSEIIHLYTSNDFTGEVNFDCNEGQLAWIAKNDIFSLPLWEGDRAFLKVLNSTSTYFEMTLVYRNDVLVSVTRNL